MQKTELDKLLALTAITLTPDQEPAFLEYFANMKQMFDEFCNISLLDGLSWEGVEQEKKFLQCFTEGEEFKNVEWILANVDAERLMGNAIGVKSIFGE